MTTGELVPIVGGYALVSSVAGVVLYRRLRLKFERLSQKQRQLKRQFDRVTRDAFSQLAELNTVSGRVSSALIGFDKRIEKISDKLDQIDFGAMSAANRGSPVLGSDKCRVRIIINTLPKVGSSSIASTLRQSLPEAIVEHTHSVSLEGQAALARDIDTFPIGQARNAMKEHFQRSMTVRPELERLQIMGANENVYFICGIRDPLAWALSFLFQIFTDGGLPSDSVNVDNAQRLVMDIFSGRPLAQWTPAPIEWMQREIVGYLGVNPMIAGFDQIRGYQVVDTMRGRLLLLRQENFERLPQALADLLTAPASMFKIEQDNVTADKSLGDRYKQVASELRFPRAFVDRVYSDPYSTTFYSLKERQQFAARWSL